MRACCANAGASAVGTSVGVLELAAAVLERDSVDEEGAFEDWMVLTHVDVAVVVRDATVFGGLVRHLMAVLEPMSHHCRQCPACCNVAAARLADFISAVARARDTKAADGDWVARRIILLCSLVASVLHLQESAVMLALDTMRALDRVIASQIVLGANCSESTKAAISNALMPTVCLFIANQGVRTMEAADKLMKTLSWNKPPLSTIALVLIVQVVPHIGFDRAGQAWFRRWWATCWKWLWGTEPVKPFVSDEAEFSYKMCAAQKTSTALSTLLRRRIYGAGFKAMLRDCLDDIDNLTIALNTCVYEGMRAP